MSRLIKSTRKIHPDEEFWILEGRLSKKDALLLEREYSCVPWEKRSRLCINLERVTSIDDYGVQVLGRMQDERVYLESVSPLIRDLLHRRCEKTGARHEEKSK